MVRIGKILAVDAVTVAALAVVPASAQAATTTSITIDGGSTGRTYDGVGAISGDGGNSRLLLDYPAAQRARILDYRGLRVLAGRAGRRPQPVHRARRALLDRARLDRGRRLPLAGPDRLRHLVAGLREVARPDDRHLGVEVAESR